MKTKIGALVISALILLVAAPVVSASSVGGVAALTVSAGPYEDAREDYQEAKDRFLEAYANWLSARADFINARFQWRHGEISLSTLIEKAKVAMLAMDDVVIKRLELLRVKVEATRGLSDNDKTAIYAEIDAEISWWQDEQTEIQNIDNVQGVVSVAIEMRGHWWNTTRVKILDIGGQILSAWIDALVQKAEAFAGRVEAKIEELKENGVDTSELESWLADYRSAIDSAEEKYDEAKDKFSQISSAENPGQLFGEGGSLIREGNSYLRDAFKALRDIVSDLRNKGHTVTLSESGTLVAHGDGQAYITGTGTVHVRAPIQGTMLVSPNAVVTTSGTGTKTVLENSWVLYQGYGGAVVTGTDIVVDISGDDISILAAGTGSVVLTGTGWYRTYGLDKYVEGSWTATSVTVTLATGEVSAGVS